MKLEEAINKLEELSQYESVVEDHEEAISTALQHIKHLQKENELARKSLIENSNIADERNDLLVEVQKLKKENEELKNMDLTTVYIKGVADEKERWRNKIKRKRDELRIQVTSKEFTHDMYMGTEKFIMFTKLCAMGEVLQDLLK